jgi:hypothetical protein
MIKFYRVSGVFSLFLTLLCPCVSAQTTIAVMDFDGTAPEMTVSSSVPFADNGSATFFGIYDANDDDTDGTPTDTGDTPSTTRPNNVNGAPVSGDFLFMVSENSFTPGAAETSFTVGPVSVAGQSDVVFSFFYRAYDYDGGDDIFYEFTVDGTPQGRVQIVDGVNNGSVVLTPSETIDYIVPAGAGDVSVTIFIDQAGDDYAAFDNFIVTADNPGLPCGVTAFGPAATAECVAFTNGTADEYTLSLDYSGTDMNGTLALLVDNAVATFTNNGDDPTAVADGTINLSSPDLVEGTDYEITFTDAGGSCTYSVTGSVTNNTCVSVCDLTVDPIRFFCDAFTAGTDAVSAEIRYFGSEAGVTVVATGGLTVGGDDPATDPGGTGVGNARQILLSGLQEGDSYTITISGGACTGGDAIIIDVVVPADLCQPVGDIVINEFYASPITSMGEFEFIELYNRGLGAVDVSNYTLEEAGGRVITIPMGTTLNAGETLIVVAGNATPAGCQVVNTTFISLNNDGDVIILRDASGNILQQLSYGTEAEVRESLALSPDGNLDGGYQLHSTIATNGETTSPCLDNDNSALPVELISFSGAVAGKTIRLSWGTATEINNDHFRVQRLVRDNNWATIGNVSALGGRNNTYDFTDEAPFQADNVYRLQQVDLDGTTTVYGPVVVAFTSEELSIWPNPAGSEIRFSGSQTSGTQVSLLDANGRVLQVLPPGSDRADLTGMPAGIYLLRVARASGTEVVRFVKQ